MKISDALIDETELASRLRLSVTRLARRLRQQAGFEAEVTPSQLATLSSVERLGPITLGDLAAVERVQPPTMTRIVSGLEEAGLVIRRPNPRDRRVNVLVVTARGATVRKQLIARLLDPPDAFRRMPVGEQARFREVMRETLSGRGPDAARRGGSGRRT